MGVFGQNKGGWVDWVDSGRAWVGLGFGLV